MQYLPNISEYISSLCEFTQVTYLKQWDKGVLGDDNRRLEPQVMHAPT